MKKTDSINKESEQWMSVKYEIQSDCTLDKNEPLNYITEIKGDIFLQYGIRNEKQKIGILSSYSLDMINVNENELSFEDMLDGHSANISSYTNDFFDYYVQRIKPSFFGLPKEKESTPMVNILIVDYIILDSKYISKEFELKVLENIEHVFGQGKLVILKPFPLQYGNMDKDIISEFHLESLALGNNKLNVTTRKLKDIYKSFGYKTHRGTKLFYKDLTYNSSLRTLLGNTFQS
jgi:hypothetical protein